MGIDREAARAANLCSVAIVLSMACLAGCPESKPKPQQLGYEADLDSGTQDDRGNTSANHDAGAGSTDASPGGDDGNPSADDSTEDSDASTGDGGNSSMSDDDAGEMQGSSCMGEVGSPANEPEPDCTSEASLELSGFLSDLVSQERISAAQLTETGCGNTVTTGPDGGFIIRVPAYDSIYIRAIASGYAPGLSARIDTSSGVNGGWGSFSLVAADLVTPFLSQCADGALLVVQTVLFNSPVLSPLSGVSVSDGKAGVVTYTDAQLQARDASTTDDSGLAVIDKLIAPDDDTLTATRNGYSQVTQDAYPFERGYVTAARVDLASD
jgi:hypothetical protein